MLQSYELFPCTIWWLFAVGATAVPSVPAAIAVLPNNLEKDAGR